jgi:ATP-binding cassette, subfamily B, bacterial PglK
MQHTSSISNLLRRLWRQISPRRRWQYGLLIVLMLFGAFADILSIGAVLPFIGAMADPVKVFEHPAAQLIIQVFGLTQPDQLLMPLTIIFCLAVLMAGAMRLLLLWASLRLSHATGADFSIRIYKRTLYQPYSVHISRNSSEIISGISAKVNSVINNTILPIVTLSSASIILTGILIALLSVEPLIALVAFGGFGLIYAIILLLTRKQLLRYGKCVDRESVNVIKALQEGLGAIRDVLIDGNQSGYFQIYRNADLPMRRAQANRAFIGSSPRFAIEALGMLLISALAYTLFRQPGGFASAIPILGALALGAQRLLPVMQQAYMSLTSFQGDRPSLENTLELLEQPLPDYLDQPPAKPMSFRKQISLKELSFRYSSQTPFVLQQLNLTIVKGSRIGFIGHTGSGKSTLLDIIMSLLQPTDGVLEIDGQPITPYNVRAWQSHIAHVPQTIFLADSTIEENIAFGVPKDQIDPERVKKAAQQAQVADSIESWPKQYQTFVGERGVRLSGGQRQRIGIARALYKGTNIIVFDEATSALDSETEQSVMQAIESLSKSLTLLIIAHRLSTLKNCTQIVELSQGDIKFVGTYQEVVNQ